jgi:hypothetical protein
MAEVEITAEMVEAGRQVIPGHYRIGTSPLRRRLDGMELEAIYRAMRTLEPRLK